VSSPPAQYGRPGAAQDAVRYTPARLALRVIVYEIELPPVIRCTH
jgi:hypothetical protein